VLALVGLVVALAVAVLWSSSHGRGLEGLGEALAGVGLVFGYVLHTALTTVIVALARDRSGVAVAHLASPALVLLCCLVWCR